MTQKISKLFACGFALLCLASCGGGSSNGGGTAAETPPPATVSTKVVAIGDSIGTGFGIATPWPTLLSNLIGAPVANSSVSGEQTGFGLGIIADRLSAEQPTHVVILLGTNDAIRGSVSGAISNLQSMVDIATGQNVIAIVATLPPITRSSSENARIAQINSGIRGLSGARIADVRGRLNNGDISADGVHPNQGGQNKIASTIAELF